MALRDVTLDDKFDLGQRHIFVTGFQALVRLCLMQKELDRRNGLNTAGFVTGYRGSPLGTLDSQFLRARRFLEYPRFASTLACALRRGGEGHYESALHELPSSWR